MTSLTNELHLQAPQPIFQTQAPSGTGVRMHGIHFIRTSWQNISRASKFMLVSSVFFIVSQIVVSIAILVIFQSRVCDKPLDTYITVHAIRLDLLLPLLVYQYLTRPNFLQRRQEQQDSTPQPSQTNDSTSSSSRALSPSPNLIPIVSSSNRGNTTKEWCERLKSVLDLFGILWFIVGNYLLFTSTTCPVDAPELYYTVMAWVLLSYTVILIPILLCASIIFCLPCVLVVLRLLHIADVPGMTVGATQEEILEIPVFKYQPSPNTNESNTAPSISNFGTAVKSSSWSHRLLSRFKKNKNDVEARSYPPITIVCSEDAVCSICLSEYETDDLICKLWCGHHFHRGCVSEWLTLNCLCPLCKQNFRGKDHDNDDATDEPTHP